ncbi:MAG: diaminopimelate epimerase [Methanomicrobiales archaeon]|nr:diaminopimelate epimerase [Methanomicrobiales archaeon]
MDILFTKLQGNGNDFILIDEFGSAVIPDDMKGEFASLYCDRRFGIGGDGVLYLSASDKADLKMRLFQPDQSEAEMCGNGIRCFVRYAVDAGYVRESCKVETPAGIISVRMEYRENIFMAAVDMPTPRFNRSDIPATGEAEYLETISGLEVRAVNIGVPHAVIRVDDVEKVDIARLGPFIRHHETFPKGANVDFVQLIGDNALRIRTFERGVEDETLSCGTGATAAAVILHRLGMVGETVQVETTGGSLIIYLKDNAVLEGPAESIFVGAINIP